MRQSVTGLFTVALDVWTSTVLTCAVLLVASAHMAQAGINTWTTHGPYGGRVLALAINPTTPSTLYAGTNGGVVFDIEQVSSVPVCTGDCDGSSDVSVNELITMVNIALGDADISTCVPGDADNSGTIEISEIIQAVNNALSGCGGG